MTTEPWHTLDAQQALERLETAREGLTTDGAEKRRRQYGRNVLPESRGRSVAGMLLNQFKDFMILVLIAAAVISGFVGEPQDTIAIIVILLLNAIIGTVQEFRAERASLWTIGLFTNPAMLGAVLLTVLLQLAVIYVPVLNGIFHTAPLPLLDLAVCLGLASSTLVVVEIEKSLARRGWIYAAHRDAAAAGAPPRSA